LCSAIHAAADLHDAADLRRGPVRAAFGYVPYASTCWAFRRRRRHHARRLWRRHGAGATLAGAVIRRLPFGVVVGIGPVTGFIAALIMASTLWLRSGALAGLSFFLLGAGPILWVITTTTLRQTVTPRACWARLGDQHPGYGARLWARASPPWSAKSPARGLPARGRRLFAAQAGIILVSSVPRLAALRRPHRPSANYARQISRHRPPADGR